jgi:HSP20 family molecular chaperone IbpA
MADMPGLTKRATVVQYSATACWIEGAATVALTGDMELVYGEIQSPQYRRSFTLSRELDTCKIGAVYNGVLNLRIPRPSKPGRDASTSALPPVHQAWSHMA